jgi:hypothetical protein
MHVISRNDSIGGSHSADDELDLTVAFSEGFSDAFAAINGQYDPAFFDTRICAGSTCVPTAGAFYLDTKGANQGGAEGLILQVSNNASAGPYSEASVAFLVYAASVSAGFSSTYDALKLIPTMPAFSSIFSYLKAVASVLGDPTQIEGLVQLAALKGVTAGDEFGPLAAPAYTLLALDNPVLKGTSEAYGPIGFAAAGDGEAKILEAAGNKRDNWQFFQFQVAAAGCYALRAEPKAGASQRLVIRGINQSFGLSTGLLTVFTYLTPGKYAFAVGSLAESPGPSGGQADFFASVRLSTVASLCGP